MTHPVATSKAARRAFLGGIAGMAAFIPIASCLAQPASSESTEAAVVPEGDGYRLTSHVRSYYRSATALYP